MFFWFLRRTSPSHRSHGLPVWTPLATRLERSLIYGRLNEALTLLRTHAPGRHQRILRYLKGFMVLGTDPTRASYDFQNAVCRLGEAYMTDPETTATAIACTVVHEATHARLFSLGIGYEEPIRHRVELACIRASLLAAQRLPDGASEVKRCRAQMLIAPEYFSEEKYLERRVSYLRQLGCPDWFVRTVAWFARKRAA